MFVFLTIVIRLPHYKERDFNGILTKSSRPMPAIAQRESFKALPYHLILRPNSFALLSTIKIATNSRQHTV